MLWVDHCVLVNELSKVELLHLSKSSQVMFSQFLDILKFSYFCSRFLNFWRMGCLLTFRRVFICFGVFGLDRLVLKLQITDKCILNLRIFWWLLTYNRSIDHTCSWTSVIKIFNLFHLFVINTIASISDPILYATISVLLLALPFLWARSRTCSWARACSPRCSIQPYDLLL